MEEGQHEIACPPHGGAALEAVLDLATAIAIPLIHRYPPASSTACPAALRSPQQQPGSGTAMADENEAGPSPAPGAAQPAFSDLFLPGWSLLQQADAAMHRHEAQSLEAPMPVGPWGHAGARFPDADAVHDASGLRPAAGVLEIPGIRELRDMYSSAFVPAGRLYASTGARRCDARRFALSRKRRDT